MIELFITAGRNIGATEGVTDELLEAFLVEQVDTRFDGWTMTESRGSWMGVRERSFTLSFLVEEEEASTARAAVEAIGEAFCEQFDQDAVITGERPANVRFISRGVIA